MYQTVVVYAMCTNCTVYRACYYIILLLDSRISHVVLYRNKERREERERERERVRVRVRVGEGGRRRERD